MMNNIRENVRLISFRGQLYEGDRQRMTEEDKFIFGEAEYYTTSYAEASTYAKASITINPDLVSNIENIAKTTGEPYSDVRQRILDAGDGKVITSYITSDRMMVYGMDGKQFFDVSDEQLFRSRFGLALLEIDVVSRDERERITNFVVKFNNDPERVMFALKQENCTQVLRSFASICNCDSFRTHPSITPHASILRKSGMDNGHVMVMDKSKVHVLRTDGVPITMDEKLLSVPNPPREEYAANAREVVKASDNMEWDIVGSVRFSVEAIAERLRVESQESQQAALQDRKEAKPSEPKQVVRSGFKMR